MSGIVVVGTQWGDEGKGKITDFLAQRADVVVRYQGGDNAGHTVEFNNMQFKIRLVPSGIFNSRLVILGNGMVINPKTLIEEIEMLNERGIDTSNLKISNRAHIIMPYHMAIDELQEEQKGSQKVGTTKKGIGPAYMDKVSRIGIRFGELLDDELFAEKVAINVREKNQLLALHGKNLFNVEAVIEEYRSYAEVLKQFIDDTSYILNKEIEAGSKVLFEGAQGIMLDIDHGTYPFVTSSNPSAGYVTIGSGVGPKAIDKVLGIVKAYSTRVGEGPFPTEIDGEIAHQIREVGREYGTVTKRPRRIGWFDGVIVKYAARISGLTGISVNLLDVLSGLEKLYICKGYEFRGEEIDYIPSTVKEFAECKPIYIELDGWTEDITGVRSFEELPKAAQNYLKTMSEVVGVPISIFSIGPDREQTIIMEDLF